MLKDVNVKYLLLILEYIYCGEVDLAPENVTEFKRVAQSLQIVVKFNIEDPEIDDTLPRQMSQDMLADSSTIEHEMSLEEDEVVDYECKMERSDDSQPGLTIASVTSLNSISPTDTAGAKLKPQSRRIRVGYTYKSATISCVYCDKEIRERDKNSHQKFCWSNPKRIVSDCTLCSKQFTVPSKLRLHIERQHKVKVKA